MANRLIYAVRRASFQTNLAQRRVRFEVKAALHWNPKTIPYTLLSMAFLIALTPLLLATHYVVCRFF